MSDTSSTNTSDSHQVVKLLGAIVQKLGGLGIQLGAKSTSASAGAATLPSNPVGFATVTFSDGTTGKMPYYGP